MHTRSDGNGQETESGSIQRRLRRMQRSGGDREARGMSVLRGNCSRHEGRQCRQAGEVFGHPLGAGGRD